MLVLGIAKFSVLFMADNCSEYKHQWRAASFNSSRNTTTVIFKPAGKLTTFRIAIFYCQFVQPYRSIGGQIQLVL